ncbi:uncharacterized protein LOC101238868 isoform X1 [Hydra vulgaris]|uniref:Uncharacterized protein LOC101238868 isoform X1 n=2 Tax=Hydra vulgaris TaxID=6087 RepID=A0ABM4BDA5_HYDVU
MCDSKIFVLDELSLCRKVTEDLLNGNVEQYSSKLLSSLYASIESGTKATEVFSTTDFEVFLTKLLLASLCNSNDLSLTLQTAHQCNLFSEEYRVTTFLNKKFWNAIVMSDLPDVQFFEAFLVYVSCSSKKTQYIDRVIETSAFVSVLKRLIEIQKKNISSKETSFSLKFSDYFRECKELQNCYDFYQENMPVAVLCYILTSCLKVDSFLRSFLKTPGGVKIIFDVLKAPCCFFMHPAFIYLLMKTTEQLLLEGVKVDIENLFRDFDFKHVRELVISENKIIRKYAQLIIRKVCDAKIFYGEIRFPAWEDITMFSSECLKELLYKDIHDQTFSLDLIGYIHRLSNNNGLKSHPSEFYEFAMLFLKSCGVKKQLIGDLVIAALKAVLYLSEKLSTESKLNAIRICLPFTCCNKGEKKGFDLPGTKEVALWVCSRLMEKDEDCIVEFYQHIELVLLVEETFKLGLAYTSETLHPKNCSQNMFTYFTLLNHMFAVNEVLKYTPLFNCDPLVLSSEVISKLCQMCSLCIDLPFLTDLLGKKVIYMLSVLIVEDQMLVKELISYDTVKLIQHLFITYDTCEYPYLIKCRLIFKHYYPKLLWIGFYEYDEFRRKNHEIKVLNEKTETHFKNELKIKCAWHLCESDTPVLFKCGQCFLTNYCSQTCQRNDWRSHKQTCAKNI